MSNHSYRGHYVKDISQALQTRLIPYTGNPNAGHTLHRQPNGGRNITQAVQMRLIPYTQDRNRTETLHRKSTESLLAIIFLSVSVGFGLAQ